MPQRSATVAQCAVVCSPFPSDDGDGSHTLRPACVLGVFFVKKENRLRLIVDCRKASALLAPPPSVDLLSRDGLSRIEVDSTGLAHGESPGLHYGCADVADCFHRMRLSTFSAGQGVSNKCLKMTEIEGMEVSPNQSLWPMCCEPPLRSARKPRTTVSTAIPAT